jgi:hypothetical protein
MISHRKQFDGVWSVFNLGKEDVAKVSTITIASGLKKLQEINKMAKENNILLSDTDRSAMLIWSALTFESYGSDYIEAKVAASRAEAKAKSEEKSIAPQAPQ